MKRKRYPKNFKEQLVKEAQEVGNALSVAKRHGVGAKTLYKWIQDSKHKAWEETDGNAKKIATYIPSPQEFRQMEKENNTLDSKIKVLNRFKLRSPSVTESPFLVGICRNF